MLNIITSRDQQEEQEEEHPPAVACRLDFITKPPSVISS